jgi:hypothetical protein
VFITAVPIQVIESKDNGEAIRELAKKVYSKHSYEKG